MPAPAAAFFNVVDLVNKLEADGRAGRQGRIADYLTRMDFIILDELGHLPFASAGGQLPHPPRRARAPPMYYRDNPHGVPFARRYGVPIQCRLTSCAACRGMDQINSPFV